MEMKKLFLGLSLVLLVPVGANAQFGKLKKAVKGAVKGTATEASKSVSGNSSSSSNTAAASAVQKVDDKNALTKTYEEMPGNERSVKVTGVGKFDIDKVYEPSAQAKANDPKASDTTTPNGYNRTVAQIHAAYEHLNPAWFPQPYYDYPMFYYMDDEQSTKFQWNTMGYLMNKIMEQHWDKEYRNFFYFGNYKDDNVHDGPIVPHGYPSIQAKFARFLADPQSYAAVAGMLEAHFYVRDRQKGYYDGVHLPGNSDSKVIYKNEGFAKELGTMNFTKGEWEKMQDEADLFCIGVLYQKVPFPILERAFKVKLVHFEKYADNDYMKAMYCMQLEAAKEIYDGHPGNTKSGEHESLMQRYNAIVSQKEALYAAGKMAMMPVVKLDNTYKKDATFKKQVLEMGKKKLPNVNIEEVVFFNEDWDLFKSSEWPYPVTQRSQNVGFIYKKDGTYYISRYTLQQFRKGDMGSNVFEKGSLMGEGEPRKVEYPRKK